MRWCLLLGPLLACQAQQELPADVLLLAKIKVQMAENLKRLPNYTCGQTIERFLRLPKERRLKPLDIVRLEVALVDGNELYGWPGSNRISESELSDLVGGTIGNGDFGLLARSIFLGSGVSFTYRGQVSLNGNPAILYDYRVPLLSSGYHIKVGANEALVAYHGSVWVAPETLDLLRLELAADDIPEYLGLAASTKALGYERTRIGGSDFLLPNSAELNMLEFSGLENRNRTRFNNCRQYSGESVLSFAEPPSDAPAETKPASREIDLPGDFKVHLSLMTPIDSATSAVGDEVWLRLEQTLKTGRQAIAPKGAILTGRILKLYHLGRFFYLTFSIHSLSFENAHADLNGRENTVFMIMKIHTPGLTPMYGYKTEEDVEKRPMVIEADRLKLPRGFLLALHSRLVKSDKQ